MVVRAHSFEVQRGVAEHVHVELDLRAGLPSFAVIGLAGAAARDARERVRAAVLNSGFAFPRKRVTVNLAPASSRRTGAAFDLAIACCVLAVQDQLDARRLVRIGLFAELGLGGSLRPCSGVAVAAQAADHAGLDGLIVAYVDLVDARRAATLAIAGARDLREVAALLAPGPPKSPVRSLERAATARSTRGSPAGARAAGPEDPRGTPVRADAAVAPDGRARARPP